MGNNCWRSSSLDDTYERFRDNALKELEEDQLEKPESNSNGTIQWKIRERNNWGIPDINRNNSSLQKDWVILKSHQLPETLFFSVNAHKGWDANKESIPYALVVSLEILGKNIPIYEEIRLANEVELEV